VRLRFDLVGRPGRGLEVDCDAEFSARFCLLQALADLAGPATEDLLIVLRELSPYRDERIAVDRLEIRQ
jgi:hypothetical protein